MADTAPSTDGAVAGTPSDIATPSNTVALRDLAFDGLRDVAPEGTVGELVSVTGDGEVREVAFASLLPGYRAWRWTVQVAVLPDLDFSVLEVALLPGEGALVAPSWVPWADRLAEYRRLHPDDANDDAVEDPDDEDVDDDDDVIDDDEVDDDVDPVDDDLDEDLEIADPDEVDPDEFDPAEFDPADSDEDDEPDSGVPEPDDAADDRPRA